MGLTARALAFITSISGGDFGITPKEDRFQRESKWTMQNFILIPWMATRSMSRLLEALGQGARDTTCVLHRVLCYFVLLVKVLVQV